MTNNKIEKMNEEQVLLHIKKIENWNISDDYKLINKTFLFKNFKEAFTWMSYISIEAEIINHHPDWKNVYNKVTVCLSTHDIDGLSEKDFILANLMDTFFLKFRN